MSETAEKFNLTPQERRIVMGIFLVVIFVLNYLFVWPHFGEWGRTRRQLQQARDTIVNWNREIEHDIDPNNGYKTQLSKLRQQGGTVKMTGDQQVQLQETIRREAVRTHVNVNNYTPASSRGSSNAFFEDQSTQISFDSREPELIDFLYNIGNDPAMIRVSELSLRPADQQRYRLSGTVTLTASYSKRPAVAPPPSKKPAAKGPAPAKGPNPPAAGPPGKRQPFTPPPGPRPAGAQRPFPMMPGQRKGP